MTENAKPRRLELKDLPRDPEQAISGSRQALVASFNYCRIYPHKMKILKAVVRYVFMRIQEWEKEETAQKLYTDKLSLEMKGRKVGIELDRRKSLSEMQADLDEWITKSDEARAEQKFKDERAAEALALTIKRKEADTALKTATEAVKALAPTTTKPNK